MSSLPNLQTLCKANPAPFHQCAFGIYKLNLGMGSAYQMLSILLYSFSLFIPSQICEVYFEHYVLRKTQLFM